MNSDELQGKWKQLKGSARQQFGKLTDDDLEMIAGQRDRLIGKLQERYGYLREDAQKKADEWLASAKSTGAGASEQQRQQHGTSSQQTGSQQTGSQQHNMPPASSRQQGSQEHAHKR